VSLGSPALTKASPIVAPFSSVTSSESCQNLSISTLIVLLSALLAILQYIYRIKCPHKRGIVKQGQTTKTLLNYIPSIG